MKYLQKSESCRHLVFGWSQANSFFDADFLHEDLIVERGKGKKKLHLYIYRYWGFIGVLTVYICTDLDKSFYIGLVIVYVYTLYIFVKITNYLYIYSGCLLNHPYSINIPRICPAQIGSAIDNLYKLDLHFSCMNI